LAQDHLDAADPLERPHRSPDVGVDALLEGAPGDGQEDMDANPAVLDRDPAQHAEVLDRLADLRIPHLAQGLADVLFGGQTVLLRRNGFRRPPSPTTIRRRAADADAPR